MPVIKHSRQRDAILQYLAGTKAHPTADTIYESLRQEYPNISLGTVYRNLGLLCELGEIQKLSIPGHSDRYDFTTANHYHFICRRCGCVQDLPVTRLGNINRLANIDFDGIIESHQCQFFGTCARCSELGH